MSELVDVIGSGAVLLGEHVSCDGFHRSRAVRVQSHIHDDHMYEFETSKGFQEIFMSPATRELLIAEYDADLDVRENLRAIEEGVPVRIPGGELTLLDSGHMLGAVQVSVQLDDGPRVGYSGDFSWPLDTVMQVDALVVDSTYGSPESCRRYDQGEAEAVLLQTVTTKLRQGPVYIKASRGTIERALHTLSGNVTAPLIASARLCHELAVYRNYGYAMDEVYRIGTPEGQQALSSGQYIRFYGKGDQLPVSPKEGTTITLSAYQASPDNPLLEYSDRACRVALSNHADFRGTVEYVAATRARLVVTDNMRGGHAVELATYLTAELGVYAVPSTNTHSREWGL